MPDLISIAWTTALADASDCCLRVGLWNSIKLMKFFKWLPKTVYDYISMDLSKDQLYANFIVTREATFIATVTFCGWCHIVDCLINNGPDHSHRAIYTFFAVLIILSEEMIYYTTTVFLANMFHVPLLRCSELDNDMFMWTGLLMSAAMLIAADMCFAPFRTPLLCFKPM
jgi:hypothetical protein